MNNAAIPSANSGSNFACASGTIIFMSEPLDPAYSEATNKYHGKTLMHYITGEQFKVVAIAQLTDSTNQQGLYLRLKPKNFFLASVHVPITNIETEYLVCETLGGQ